MLYEIKNRYNGQVIYSLDCNSMVECIHSAIKNKANLQSADLQSANLRSANLQSADLQYAKNMPVNPLDIFRHSLTKNYAFKMVTKDGYSPIHTGCSPIHYKIHTTISVSNANTDNRVICGAGINVADIEWVKNNWKSGSKLLLVSFHAKDIAAIPYGTDGKFRLFKCRVEKEIDPKTIGINT